MNVFLQNEKKNLGENASMLSKANHYLIINSNGNIKYISKDFLNGIHSFEENRSIAVGLSPKNQIVFKQKVYDSLDTQDIITFDFTISLNSKPFLYKVTLFPFFIDEAYVNATFEEINKENELQMKRFKDTYIHSVDAIIWIDPFSKNIIFSNPSFTKITGYSEKDVHDFSFINILSPKEQPKGKREFSILKKEKKIVTETILITKDQKTLPVRVNANVVTSENDTPYIVCVLKDLTALTKAKKELKDNERRYEAILDNSKIKICQFDKKLKLSWAGSSTVFDTSNFLTENDYGLTIKEIIKNEVGSVIYHAMCETLKSKNTAYKSFHISYDHEWKAVEIYLTPILENSKVVGLNAVFLNISNQKKVEDKLDHFVYRAAHDLRGPLTTMQGLVQLMDNLEVKNEYTQLLVETLWTQDMHLQKILTFYYNQKKDINIHPLNLENILSQFDSFIETSGYIIDISINNKVKNIIYTDSERLLLLFKNICTTILQHVSRDIKIKLRIEAKSIKNGIYLSFEDNVSPQDSFALNNNKYNKEFSSEYIYNDFSKGIFITSDIVEKLKGKYQVNYTTRKTQKLEIIIPDLK